MDVVPANTLAINPARTGHGWKKFLKTKHNKERAPPHTHAFQKKKKNVQQIQDKGFTPVTKILPWNTSFMLNCNITKTAITLANHANPQKMYKREIRKIVQCHSHCIQFQA